MSCIGLCSTGLFVKRIKPLQNVCAISVRAEGTPAKNPYKVLGIRQGASVKEIKAAYRKLAKQFHPDAVSSECKGLRSQLFMEIKEAYSTLVDPEKRAQYDVLLGTVIPGFKVSRGDSCYGQGCKAHKNWETDQCW